MRPLVVEPKGVMVVGWGGSDSVNQSVMAVVVKLLKELTESKNLGFYSNSSELRYKSAL